MLDSSLEGNKVLSFRGNEGGSQPLKVLWVPSVKFRWFILSIPAKLTLLE